MKQQRTTLDGRSRLMLLKDGRTIPVIDIGSASMVINRFTRKRVAARTVVINRSDMFVGSTKKGVILYACAECDLFESDEEAKLHWTGRR